MRTSLSYAANNCSRELTHRLRRQNRAVVKCIRRQVLDVFILMELRGLVEISLPQEVAAPSLVGARSIAREGQKKRETKRCGLFSLDARASWLVPLLRGLDGGPRFGEGESVRGTYGHSVHGRPKRDCRTSSLPCPAGCVRRSARRLLASTYSGCLADIGWLSVWDERGTASRDCPLMRCR